MLKLEEVTAIINEHVQEEEAKANIGVGANLPEIAEGTWESWVDGMINGRYENQFYHTLEDTIFENVVSEAINELITGVREHVEKLPTGGAWASIRKSLRQVDSTLEEKNLVNLHKMY